MINHTADEETYSADEDDWTPDRIHSIQQKIHSTETKSKNGPPFYTKTLLVTNRPIKFIVDRLTGNINSEGEFRQNNHNQIGNRTLPGRK